MKLLSLHFTVLLVAAHLHIKTSDFFSQQPSNISAEINTNSDTTDKNLQPVYDLDSNKYTVIKIGSQYWMQQNLRTSKYNDSTPVATNLSVAEWKATTTGAYAVYDNNTTMEALYGKLYNGYAVATGKLCPKGWRIPTDADWKELELFAGMAKEELNRTGGRSNLAGKIKSPQQWKASEMAIDNSTGLSILPAGTRNDYGDFMTINQFTGFWTSTEYETASNYLWYRHFYYNINETGRNYVIKNNGYSCRCIKENDPVKKTNSKMMPVKKTTTTPGKKSNN